MSINKGLNFFPHQHLKSKFHEDTINALQPAYLGSGCNISHINLYRFTQNKTVCVHLQMSYAVLYNNTENIQPLYELVTLHKLRELQCSNKHKGVSD